MNQPRAFEEPAMPLFAEGDEVVPLAGEKLPSYIADHRKRLRSRFMEGGAAAMPDYELLELVLFRAIAGGVWRFQPGDCGGTGTAGGGAGGWGRCGAGIEDRGSGGAADGAGAATLLKWLRRRMRIGPNTSCPLPPAYASASVHHAPHCPLP